MNKNLIVKWGIFVILALVLTTGLVSANAAGTRTLTSGFTYQGQLQSSAEPYTGSCDFQFKLFDDQGGGAQVGTTQTLTGVPLQAGYFTVVLDFGPAAFNGQARWLEINVRCPAGSGAYTTLSPRQALTAAPYAWFAHQAGSTPWGNVTSDHSLELHVNGQRALCLEPNINSPNLVIGFSGNSVTDGVWGAVIGGGGFDGSENRVTDHLGVIGGGANNLAGNDNDVFDDAMNATVGGGEGNRASGNGSTVGGGYENRATAAGSTVGGGTLNEASNLYATVGGGYGHSASGNNATVGGGSQNEASGNWSTIGGGVFNLISGNFSTVGGGWNNEASGLYATVPGGRDNTAEGNHSLAAGMRAKANNNGCFVWADSTGGILNCDHNNRWVARASGGVYFYTSSNLNHGMYLAANGSAWNAVSHRDLKENFTPVDTAALLEALAQYPITTWNYKAQDESILHIGMMADEFNRLIDGLGGEGEDHINSMDAVGVSLAAVQGLYAENQELKARVDNLEARLDALEAGQTSSVSAASTPLSWLMGFGLAAVAGVWLLRRPHGGA